MTGVLVAQRLNLHPPKPVRRWLSRSVSAVAERQASRERLDDWSAPLLPGTLTRAGQTAPAVVVAPAPHPAATPSAVAQLRSRANREPVRRCLLATSALDVGGMDEVVAFLARRLRRHGLETAVLHCRASASGDRPPGRLASMLSAAGIEVVALTEADGRDWMRCWRPDVVSAHGAADWVLSAAGAMAVPYVDTLHGMHSLFDVDWTAEGRRGRQLTAIVAVSELVRRQYLDGNPSFPPERILTVPNAVDDERRAPVDRRLARDTLGLRDEYLFVSLARHCLQKNTYALVDAFQDVARHHRDAHLLVAGRPEDPLYFTQVRRLRDRLACRDRVHLRDHAPDPALVLSAADGFVLDSFFEGWSLASMEALYAGVPVVVSDVGGAREQIGRDGQRGYVVANPLGDPLDVSWARMRSTCYERQANRDQLASAMDALIRDRDHWRGLRTHLAGESKDRFHPDRCLQSHARLLRSLADDSAPALRSAAIDAI